METATLNKNQIISLLTKSVHGDLQAYIAPAREAYRTDPEFYAHLIGYNHHKGSIRDSKIALPLLSLTDKTFNDVECVENSFAHVALLTPRQLVQGYRNLVLKHCMTLAPCLRRFREFTTQYLQARENNYAWFERQALQHRASLKDLYALFGVKPVGFAREILFERQYAKGSVFAAVRDLSDMSPQEAAGTILNHKIPFLIARGALGKRMQDTDIALALIEGMSPTELVTNAKMLEKMGVKNHPALRGALDAGLKKASTSIANVLKTTQAIKALQGDEEDNALADTLEHLQETQLSNMQGIEGSWLVLADVSGSMQHSMELGKQIAGILTRMVQGTVWLVFFNDTPRAFNVTGETFEEITQLTRHVRPQGSTSIACGLSYAMMNQIHVDGITVISDGGENQRPVFAEVYSKYIQMVGKDVPVYFYRVVGDRNVFSHNLRVCGIECQEFDLTGGVDYYSLPTLVTTMRVNRWSLVDEVYHTPLLTLPQGLRVPRMYR